MKFKLTFLESLTFLANIALIMLLVLDMTQSAWYWNILIAGAIILLVLGLFRPTELKVKIINKSNHPDPEYAKPGDAGMDLRANIDAPIILKPLQRALVPTGLYIELPKNTEAQIRPRSGLAYTRGITVLNSPGTIDSPFRGEVKVLLVNLSDQDFIMEDGERIAQMVVAKHETVEWKRAAALTNSERGEGGFGHSGNK